MSKHTKGPWVFDGESTVFDDRKRDPVCNVDYCCPQEDHANGRLIAAAPELLEALQACSQELRLMIDKHNQRDPDDGSYAYDYQTVFEADQAIAKALTPES